MKVNNEYDNQLTAKKALVVYQSASGKTLCTINPVEGGRIQPGVPVDASKLAGLFKAIGSGEVRKDGKLVWQDQHILARGPNTVLWYAPPRQREIFFSCGNKTLMKCSGKIFPYPGLVFLSFQSYLKVYAVKSHPTRQTRLYHAPFWNIGNGSVCLPATAKDGPHSTAEWEKIFFTSAFSHPGATKQITRTRFEKLVPALIRSKAKKFPGAELIPNGMTIQDLLGEKTK